MNSYKSILFQVNHDLTFQTSSIGQTKFTNVQVGSIGSFHGSGSSKRLAEEMAAEKALYSIEIENPVVILQLKALKENLPYSLIDLGQISRESGLRWRVHLKCGTLDVVGEGDSKAKARAAAAESILATKKKSSNRFYHPSTKKVEMNERTLPGWHVLMNASLLCFNTPLMSFF